MEDIVIIGAGPAGLTAAIYVQRAGKHAVVYEGKIFGGQIINSSEVANYPAIKAISGSEFATQLYNQAVELGAEIRFESVTGIKINKNKKTIQTPSVHVDAKAVIIATGASSRPLGVENESKFIGKGVSYCATCDGNFFKGKTVCVVGGGNTALEDAIYLSTLCKTVNVIHRNATFKGEQRLVDQLKTKKNVKYYMEHNVTKLIGKTELQKIEITNKAGEKHTISTAGLFIAVGQIPSNSAFANVININEYGYAIAGEDCQTNIDGLFVAGDVRTKQVRQLTTACADGTVAGIAACNYINSLKSKRASK